MTENKQKILLSGIGSTNESLLRSISAAWDTIVLEIHQTRITELQQRFPAVEFINGDASSIITWKNIDTAQLRGIILAGKDQDVAIEACRLAREVFHLEIPIIILDSGEFCPEVFAEYGPTMMNPLSLAGDMILNKLQSNYSRAIEIGLNQGEIIEFTVSAKSHLTDRKINNLKASKWRLAAIYRGNRLIIPAGDTTIKVGDRIVVVGEPKILQNLANIFLKGIPQFPLQYGTSLAVALHCDRIAMLDEAIYFHKHVRSQRIDLYPYRKRLSKEIIERIRQGIGDFSVKNIISSTVEMFHGHDETGMYVICSRASRLLRIGLFKEIFRTSHRPFLIARERYPYDGIVVSLNCPNPLYALETGLELSRLFDVKLRVVYVTLPKELRDQESATELKSRREILADFEGIYKKKMDYLILEGNPVIETLKFTTGLQKELLVMGYDRRARISMFNPNVPFMIARRSRLSTLLIPQAD